MKPAVVRRVTCLGCFLMPLLAGCSLSPAISHDVTDYYRVNDLAANRIILLNILRAKDGLPLHFSELSQIRGSLSAGVSANTNFPYGSSYGGTRPTKMASIGMNVSSAPSFDITSLDTKDFTEGVMSQIDPETVRFFLDEGIDYRMVLMLLVSGIRQAGSDEMILNSPDSSRYVCYKGKPAKNALPNPSETSENPYSIMEADQVKKDCISPKFPEQEYYSFLRIVNNIGRLYAVEVRPLPSPVGVPITLHAQSELPALLKMNPDQYTLKYLSTGKHKGMYQLMTLPIGSLTVLCREAGNGPHVVSVLSDSGDSAADVPADACNPNGATKTGRTATPGASRVAPSMVHIGTTPGTFVIKLRSTLEVIQYLGEVINFQRLPNRRSCITVVYRNSNVSRNSKNSQSPTETNKQHVPPMTCNGDALFYLVNSSSPRPSSDISIEYDGQKWALPAPRICTVKDQQTDNCDHTLETMSMISLLLDKNKSAKDIQTTPAVQAVP